MNKKTVSLSVQVTREQKIALDNAAEETGKTRKAIIKDAIEDWLIAHDYMDPLERIAI